MSELEHCRLAHEGKLDALIEKIQSNKFEDLSRKKDQVSIKYYQFSLDHTDIIDL